MSLKSGEVAEEKHLNDCKPRLTRRARGPRTAPLSGAGGWILAAKLAFFMDLDFVRFVGESLPPAAGNASRWAARGIRANNVKSRR